jgi:hypothetical protein
MRHAAALLLGLLSIPILAMHHVQGIARRKPVGKEVASRAM